MELIDTHCHLNFHPLGDNPQAVLVRARKRGVSQIIVPAYDLESWSAVKELQKMFGVHIALGLHPWVALEPVESAELERQLERSGAVAIGEIGLDFKISPLDRSRQVEILRLQLEIAQRLDLPVLLHCRGAFEEMLKILDEFRPTLRGVLHAFSRGAELAERFIDLGLHIAFGGAITRPNAKRARDAASRIELERIILETDAPSIGLQGIESRDAEPGHVGDVAAALAKLRRMPVEVIAERTTCNAKQLFRIT